MRSLIILLGTLLPWVATAQNKEQPRTCRILFIAPPAGAPEKLHLFDGASSQEVELGRMSFSPVYQLRPGEITLALLTEAPAATGADGRPPAIPPAAPKVTLKETVNDFYLIVSSDPANTVAPVRMQVINAGADRFKAGQMMWYNLTDSLVGGVVGSQKLRIQPNSRLIIDAPANGPEDYPVNIHYVPPGKQQSEPLCETRWIHDPRSRGVFFVLKEQGSIAPRIIGIPDFREKPREER